MPLLFICNKVRFSRDEVHMFLLRIKKINWASLRENMSSGVVNNKGADQPAHPHSLISAFVIGLFESIIFRLAVSEISFF